MQWGLIANAMQTVKSAKFCSRAVLAITKSQKKISKPIENK